MFSSLVFSKVVITDNGYNFKICSNIFYVPNIENTSGKLITYLVHWIKFLGRLICCCYFLLLLLVIIIVIICIIIWYVEVIVIIVAINVIKVVFFNFEDFFSCVNFGFIGIGGDFLVSVYFYQKKLSKLCYIRIYIYIRLYIYKNVNVKPW